MNLSSSTGHCPVFVYVINVDWYFNLHWVQRALATLTAGAEVHIVMGVTDLEIRDRLIKQGFICHEWNIDRKSMNPFLNLKRLFDLYSLFKTISPDIIHAITIKPNIYVGLISHFLKIPYVLSVTGTGIVFSGETLAFQMLRPLVRGLYKATRNRVRRKIVFENYEDRDYFVNTGLCTRHEAVAILGAGVNTDLFNRLPEVNGTAPIILFAARLLWDKGLEDLVEAGKLLRQQGLKFIIEVAGIIDHSTINAIAESTLEEWHEQGLITWVGTEKNMPERITKSNIVVLPTFYGEGVPRILIEAASCGRSIVTTDIPGCREIVTDGVNGLLVPARNIQVLAEALAKLLKDAQLRKKMGDQGRARVKDDFSEQQVITETLNLYQGLLVKRGTDHD